LFSESVDREKEKKRKEEKREKKKKKPQVILITFFTIITIFIWNRIAPEFAPLTPFLVSTR
jgi:xanthine/uracil permease